MKALRRLFKSAPPPPPPPPPFRGDLPRPDQPFAVIGDIHGCRGHLEKLWARLDREAPSARIVHVGDYVDRGEHSADVLRMLFRREREQGDIVCLTGNHEQMFLDFLEDPAGKGKRWLQFGGLQTLASFGLSGIGDAVGTRDYSQIRDAVLVALGEEMTAWLKALPLSWQSGNLAVVHAGADPRLPIAEQPPQNLTWGHRAFGALPRRDGLWIVHGHTVVPMPSMSNGIISLDTGAYASGRLTAAILRPDREVEFIQVDAGG
ncbi:metallophosphoesterase [Martelella endophytica]|uniref:Calcineurin-like phosphoesterase domain-containing protein n=1 Tax=Martelella endophytica TaxID=1486262 RepID=A0A0D5LLX7_MAREN|nr:metallophosphoesterase [Martelella endophytica]AJY45209.1 hypothetical protein TM49_05100 [Martelella endophytica]